MSEDLMPGRRSFLGLAAMTIAGVDFLGANAANAGFRMQNRGVSSRSLVTRTTFASLKQIDAGVLSVGYAEDGPADGPPVVLLHGWPYDIHSFVDVAPVLAARGYRVIVPYLRGYGATRFLSSETVRNAQQSVLATDVIALMDALRIEKAIVAGFDWGARTANIVAVLWPERCKAMVSVSGYMLDKQ